jgi:hypothetical protein
MCLPYKIFIHSVWHYTCSNYPDRTIPILLGSSLVPR